MKFRKPTKQETKAVAMIAGISIGYALYFKHVNEVARLQRENAHLTYFVFLTNRDFPEVFEKIYETGQQEIINAGGALELAAVK